MNLIIAPSSKFYQTLACLNPKPNTLALTLILNARSAKTTRNTQKNKNRQSSQSPITYLKSCKNDYNEISKISNTKVPAGTTTSTVSPFFLPSNALAIGVLVASFPSRIFASFSETRVYVTCFLVL